MRKREERGVDDFEDRGVEGVLKRESFNCCRVLEGETLEREKTY